MAKEAWRRNKPTLCTLAGGAKASLIIPIKGSLENASYELKGRPNREVRVNLPEGSSLLTLKLYKLRRLGFRDLRVYRSDNAAHLRAKLAPGAGDPVVEIRTGYIKITVPVKG
jgi:hypothetical protein